jgi:hypothetical protein
MWIVRSNACRTEDSDSFVNGCESVESLDELPHDSHHAPRIGSREVDARAGLLEELFVFGNGRRNVAN